MGHSNDGSTISAIGGEAPPPKDEFSPTQNSSTHHSTWEYCYTDKAEPSTHGRMTYVIDEHVVRTA
eukprot:scaffold2835_cov72-Cylindrotheca_fusiformis.AAC.1